MARGERDFHSRGVSEDGSDAGLGDEKKGKEETNKRRTEVKKDEDEFPDVGTKLQMLTLKRENMKLQKRIAKLEAENVTLQSRIRVLKKSQGNRKNCSFYRGQMR